MSKKKWLQTSILIGMLAITTNMHAAATSLPLEDKVAQLFFVTPDQLTGIDGSTIVGETTRNAFAQYPIGGIILMESNLESEGQIRQLVQGYQQISEERTGMPIFVGIDEEGGRVARIANAGVMEVPAVPSAYIIGQSQNPDQAYEVGKTIGTYLAELGIDVDFAPVADVWTNPENQVIGDRSFGSDPELVSGMVTAQVHGFHEAGIRTAIKHFPGHGDTAEDSHNGYAYSYKTEEEQRKLEWKPFQAGIEAQTEFVMVGHICCPGITGSDTPASLSGEIMTDILRNELGFDGIVITDAMNMGAITEHYSSGEAAVLAIEAGADMILMSENLPEAYEAVLQAVKEGNISEERIDASLERIAGKKWNKPAKSGTSQ